jgi:S1-C subfamily serine protease
VRALPLQQAAEFVNCHDEVRDLVALKPMFECDGKTVTDAEADRIRARRVHRVRGQLTAPEQAVPGKVLRATGTGFVVNSTGTILTNHHVIANCTVVTATIEDGKAEQTTVIAADEAEDLALLQLEHGVPAAASLRQGALPRGGARIAVVGYPLHGRVAIKPIFRTGEMVRDPKLQGVRGRFPVKADIRRGNSGGPVLDDGGLVVGVVTAKVNTPKVFEKTGELIRDIGLAIEVSRVREFLTQNGVDYTDAAPQQSLDDNRLFARAQTFVVRVGCWQ